MKLSEKHEKLSSCKLFFVGGLPRSGTTWVQQLLNNHETVVCLGESLFFTQLAHKIALLLRDYSGKRADKTSTWAPSVDGYSRASEIDIIRRSFLNLALENMSEQELNSCVALGEKTPDNLYLLYRVWGVFPEARFINVIRDVRDCVDSAMARFESKLMDKYKDREKYVYDFSSSWQRRILDARTSAKQLGKNDQYMEVLYENLHEDPMKHASQLFDFIGVPSTEAQVQKALEEASFEKLSGGRRRGEEDAASHYRRGEVGGWRQSFTNEELAIFDREAGQLMDEFGYPRRK